MKHDLKHQELADIRLQKIMAVSLLVLLAAAYLLVQRPAAKAWAAAIETANTARVQLEESRDRAAALDIVRNEVAKLERKLKRYKPLSSPADLPNFHSQLSTLGDQLQVRKYTLKLSAPIPAEGYREWRTDITFESDFEQAMQFLRQIESIDRLTRVRGIKFDAPNPSSGLLDVKVHLSLFSSHS